TLSGYSDAGLVVSDGSFAILKSSTDWGSRVCQTNFQSTLADGPAEGLDVVDDLGPRGWLAFADSAPHVHTVERLALAEISARKLDQSGIEVDRVDHLVHSAAFLDMARPAGEGNDARAAFIERSLAIAIGPVVRGKHDLGHVGDRTSEHGIARSAIVALEDNEGVVEHLLLFEGGNDTPDLVVPRRGAGGIGAPAGIFDVLVLVEVFLRCLIGCVHRIES